MRLLVEKTLNYFADTQEDVDEYLAYRHKQLLKFGVREKSRQVFSTHTNVFYDYKNDEDDKLYMAIYIRKSETGKGLYMEVLNDFKNDNPHILTLEECKIEEFLRAKKIRYTSFKHSNAYKFIQMFYGDTVAERSRVPYIYHIDEGLAILKELDSDPDVQEAYCLHPYYQSDSEFLANVMKHIPNVSTSAVALAMEYRWVANSYLSKNNISDFVGFTCPQVREMLIADKVQNYKDFLIHHKDKHPRSDELDQYFNNWFELLEINYGDFETLIS